MEKLSDKVFVQRFKVAIRCGTFPSDIEQYEQELFNRLACVAELEKEVENGKCCGNCLLYTHEDCKDKYQMDERDWLPKSSHCCPSWQSDTLTRKDRKMSEDRLKQIQDKAAVSIVAVEEEDVEYLLQLCDVLKAQLAEKEKELEEYSHMIVNADILLLKATEKVGMEPRGCDTADALADEILGIEAQLAELRKGKI